MPRESLDASKDLPKENRCQVALGQLEDEVPGVPDKAPTDLEQPMRWGPTPDRFLGEVWVNERG